MPIIPREIEDQFEDAEFTLRRPPNSPCSGAKGYGQAWPEYVHDWRRASELVWRDYADRASLRGMGWIMASVMKASAD